MRYSLETVYKVCNDDTGEVIEVGPDPDGLDLVEIRSRIDDGTVTSSMTVTKDALPLLIEALTRMLSR